MDERTFDIINRIANEHSGKIFGYLTKEDLKNEIWAICLDKIKDFDYERGELEHFLRVSVKNRLVNRFKDITKSVRSPCPRCPFYDPKDSPSGCAKFGDDKHLCTKWRNFQLSTDSRNSLLNAAEPQFERKSSDNILNKVLAKEIKEKLLEKIDSGFKRDLEQLISGSKISKQRMKKLKYEILKILEPVPKLLNLIDLTELTIKGQKNKNGKT